MRSLLFTLLLISIPFAKTKLVLDHADYNGNRVVDGKIITTLVGNVEFTYGEVKIYADSTEWQRGTSELRLDGSVKVTRPDQTLTCDYLTFFSDTKKFELRGNTMMVDSSREVTLTSRESDFYLDEDSLEMRIDPTVYFWSSDDEDTVVVTGEPMHYLGETGTARVSKDIVVEGDELYASAGSGFYSVEFNEAQLIDSAEVLYNLNEMHGELIHLFITDETADSVIVIGGEPTGIIRDTIGTDSIKIDSMKSDSTFQQDTTVNRLTADSLYFSIDSNRVDQVVATNNAKVEQFPSDVIERADIMWGDVIITNLFEGGTGEVYSNGNARSLYQSDRDMVNEIAGDSLFLTFDSDGVLEITLTGGVQGVILSDDESE